jgi:hypothetical protein
MLFPRASFYPGNGGIVRFDGMRDILRGFYSYLLGVCRAGIMSFVAPHSHFQALSFLSRRHFPCMTLFPKRFHLRGCFYGITEILIKLLMNSGDVVSAV